MANRDDTCLAQAVGVSDPARLALDRLRRQPRSAFQDPDALAVAIGTIGTLETAKRARCAGSMDYADQAWELIARMHQAGVGGTS